MTDQKWFEDMEARIPHGEVRRSANAPNCSYFTNWSSTEDSMTWDIAVNTPGEYEAVASALDEYLESRAAVTA